MPSKTQTTDTSRKQEDATAAKGHSTSAKREPGLFERWMSIQKDRGLSTKQILADLNQEAGTIYKHNWPSVVAARHYEMERCPVAVRRHMMRVVLEDELKGLGYNVTRAQLEHLTIALT